MCPKLDDSIFILYTYVQYFERNSILATKSTSSGRPATFSREGAVERAMHLFWRDGYLAVTARDLANAMNIQRSSFYNTFGSKQNVFEEALQAYSRIAPDAGLEHIQPGQPVIPAIVDTLRELCRIRAADKEARGCLVCNSVAELVGVDAELGPALDAVIKHRIAVMKRLLQQAADNGEFEPSAAVQDLAGAFVSFLLGINVISKTIRSEDELWSICRIFLLGIDLDAGLLGDGV